MMRQLLLFAVLLCLCTSASAQYQKMAKSSSLNLSGSRTYASLAWGKLLTNRTSFVLAGAYFRDETTAITTDNFTASIGLNRWLFRIQDVYISAGVAGYGAHTNAKSAAGTKADDLSFGIALKGEIEFYPLWWLVLFGEAKQLVFLGSDYFNRKAIFGGGLKFVF